MTTGHAHCGVLERFQTSCGGGEAVRVLSGSQLPSLRLEVDFHFSHVFINTSTPTNKSRVCLELGGMNEGQEADPAVLAFPL